MLYTGTVRMTIPQIPQGSIYSTVHSSGDAQALGKYQCDRFHWNEKALKHMALHGPIETGQYQERKIFAVQFVC